MKNVYQVAFYGKIINVYKLESVNPVEIVRGIVFILVLFFVFGCQERPGGPGLSPMAAKILAFIFAIIIINFLKEFFKNDKKSDDTTDKNQTDAYESMDAQSQKKHTPDQTEKNLTGAYTDEHERVEVTNVLSRPIETIKVKFKCPQCKATGQVDQAKVPIEGIWARCPKCHSRFFIKRRENHN